MHTVVQAGTNLGATQSGMTIGGVRHVADIRADDLSRDSASHIGLQMGSNRGATQSGMTMGGVRHVADIRADDMSKDGWSDWTSDGNQQGSYTVWNDHGFVTSTLSGTATSSLLTSSIFFICL